MKSSFDDVFQRNLPNGSRISVTKYNELLDRSIADVLEVVREVLAMDLAFVSRQVWDATVISHVSAKPGEASVQGMARPLSESFCQRVLEGRLPAVVPDVPTLRTKHDVPATPIISGAYLTTPVLLQDGTLYGLLCCLSRTVSPDLNEVHHQRLEMSARQIARLVDEAGER